MLLGLIKAKSHTNKSLTWMYSKLTMVLLESVRKMTKLGTLCSKRVSPTVEAMWPIEILIGHKNDLNVLVIDSFIN